MRSDESLLEGRSLAVHESSKSHIDHLTCPICQTVAEEPHLTKCRAQHLFCKDCISRWVARHDHCPVCRDPVPSSLLPAPTSLRAVIDALTWACPNRESGCSYYGTREQMLRHLLNDCEQEEFPCQHSGCDAILARSQRDEHAMVCHRRPIQCMQCKNPVPYDAMIEHQEQHCPSVPVPCPSGCGAMVLRGSVAEHLASECMEAEMQCTYAGCHRKMKRGDFEAHEREAVVDHVRKMRAELETEYVEVSVSIPDFVSKSTGQVRNEFIETLPFFFQNTPFAIRMYPKGNHWSGPSSNNVCVYVMNLSYTHGTVGRVKYSVEIANFPQSESPNRPPQTALPIQGEEALPSSSTSPPSFSSSSSVSRKEKEDDFSRGHTGRGWESFCKLSDAFTAARASPGGALELKVTMQAHRVRGRRVLVSGVRLGSSAPASIPAGLSAPPSAAAAPLSSRGRHASHHHHHLHPHSGTVLRPQTHPTDFGPSTHYLSARGASR